MSLVIIASSLFAVTVSRSYRELTFVGSFFIFIFIFLIILPNVFAGINALALISPISSVTNLEYGGTISFLDLFLSLLPYHTLSLSFLAFAVICFDGEILFANVRLRQVVVFFFETFEQLVRRRVVYVAASIALLVPFVFLVESIFAYLILPLSEYSTIASLMVSSGHCC